MKTLLFFLVTATLNTAFAQAQYDSYSDIVRKLEVQRQQSVSTRMSVTIPKEERFHVSLGLTNTSTTINSANLGGISQNGFLIGGGLPILTNQLFFEGFAKFFQSARENATSADLQQYEVRVSHKEPMSFALFSIGIGASARFMGIEGPGVNNNLRVPSALVTTGLERRLTERISFAGDLGYHYALNNDAKNVFEFALRMNYHL